MPEGPPPPAGDEPMRLARFLARAGVTSRRKAEELISAGRVEVNGTVALDLGRRVQPDADTVHLDGHPVALAQRHLTLAFHKPVRLVTSRRDEKGRATVFDRLPLDFAADAPRLVYIGRLDYMTSGLLLLTTDGDLAARLTHPRHEVPKTYHVTTDGPLEERALEALRRGVELEDGRTLPAAVRVLAAGRCEVVLREGRNRQVRRMIEAVGGRVRALERVAFGRLSLRGLGLGPGQWRELPHPPSV